MNYEAGDAIGDWVVERQLGEGGMGSVYLCHHTADATFHVAVKVLDAGPSIASAEQRFRREAEVLREVDHPGIARFLEYGEDPPILVMEYVQGTTIYDLMGSGPIPVGEALRILRQVVEALTYLHARGIWHRDIKPGNLLVDGRGWVRVVDFGIAVAEDHSRLTGEGFFMGTLPYVPPEALDSDAVEPAGWDLYSLGVVFYEMLTGKMAFASEDPEVAGYGPVGVLLVAKEDTPCLDPGPHFEQPVRALVRAMTARSAADRITLAECGRRIMALDLPPEPEALTLADAHTAPLDRVEPPSAGVDHEAPTSPVRPLRPVPSEEAPLLTSSMPRPSPLMAALGAWGLTLALMLGLIMVVVIGAAVVVTTGDRDRAPAPTDGTVVVAGVALSTPIAVTVDGQPPASIEGVSFSYSQLTPGLHDVLVMAGEGCAPGCAVAPCDCCSVRQQRWALGRGAAQLVVQLAPPETDCGADAEVAEAAPQAAPHSERASPAPTVVEELPPLEVVSPEPTSFAAANAVTAGQFARFLKKNKKWERSRAIDRGDADGGYLSDWEGINPPDGKEERAVQGVSFRAAVAYCADRGGVATVDDGPWKWAIHSEQDTPIAEIRIDRGQPSVRFSIGVVSGDSTPEATDARFGFRCRT